MRASIVAAAVTVALLGGAAGEASGGRSVGVEAARLVASSAGYRAVIRGLLGWHHTRHNGCAAFVTTALGRAGFDVPDERLDGPWSDPARVTFSLDDYLARAGWARVDDSAALAPGDVVFTTGAPDHVMLFHRWADRRRRIAVVSDNQRRGYRRPLEPTDGGDVAGFGFARRAPLVPPSNRRRAPRVRDRWPVTSERPFDARLASAIGAPSRRSGGSVTHGVGGGRTLGW